MAGYLTSLVSAFSSHPKPRAGRLSQRGRPGQLVVPAVRVQHAGRVKHVQRGRHDRRLGLPLAARRISMSSQGKNMKTKTTNYRDIQLIVAVVSTLLATSAFYIPFTLGIPN